MFQKRTRSFGSKSVVNLLLSDKENKKVKSRKKRKNMKIRNFAKFNYTILKIHKKAPDRFVKTFRALFCCFERKVGVCWEILKKRFRTY